ncbi:MAG: hypothetical protein NT099_03705 [Candidatus Saganbacteria bacterium]|nr:hypothetical protein [Candidatus Saganbacteria bacterium]
MKTSSSQGGPSLAQVQKIEALRRFTKKWVTNPAVKIHDTYQTWAAYSQAWRLIRHLRTAPDTQNAFRTGAEQQRNYRHMAAFLGAVLASHKQEFLFRGRIARNMSTEAAIFVSHLLNTHFDVQIGADIIAAAFLTDSKTPRQVRFLSGARNLFVAIILHFPFYGLYLRFVNPLLYHMSSSSFQPISHFRELEATAQKDYGTFTTTDLQTENARTVERKYQYVTGMVDAVIDLLEKAIGGMSVEDLGFFACQRIVQAIPFMTNAMVFRVTDMDGEKRAKATAWAGKPGLDDLLTRLRAQATKGQMSYSLKPEEGPEPTQEQLRQIYEAAPDRERIVLVADPMALDQAEVQFPFANADVTKKLPGRSTVALSIMENRPIICTKVKLLEDGSAIAIDLVTGRFIQPSAMGMRALDVWEFFAAPFEGGAMLGAVDFTTAKLPREEVLHVMSVYEAYSRILGMVIQSRDLRENLTRLYQDYQRLSTELRRFAPVEAVRLLEEGKMSLVPTTRNYVTVFADLRYSTRTDRRYQERPDVPHAARNAVFELVQGCLFQSTFPTEEAAPFIKKHDYLFATAPVTGECRFRLYDDRGVRIDREYIAKIGNPRLLAFWDQIKRMEQEHQCEAFGYMGDAILGGIAAKNGKEPAEIQPENVARMLCSLVTTARELDRYNTRPDTLIKYTLKMAVHGGLVAAGVLGTEERGQYTLIGYPIDVNARLGNAQQYWMEKAAEMGCRYEEEKTLPILCSAPMMEILLESEYGRNFLARYAENFNQRILRSLMGDKAFIEVAEILFSYAETSGIPLSHLITGFLRRHHRITFTPLQIKDLLKGPFNLERVTETQAKGMEGDQIDFYLLEWDHDAYDPTKTAAPDLIRGETFNITEEDLRRIPLRSRFRALNIITTLKLRA